MMPSLFNNSSEEEYQSETNQKIAAQKAADFEERRLELQRSRNGFIGTVAGIALAAVVSWFVLAPKFSAQNESEVPLIRRSSTPAKIQPTEPGGMEIPNQDKSVYQLVEKKTGDDLKTESLLPQPETPQMPTIAPEPEPAPEPEIESEVDDANKDLLEVKPLEEKIESVKSSNGQKIQIPEKPQEISSTVKTAPAANPTSAPKAEESKKAEPAPKAETSKASAAAQGTWQIQLVASANKDAVEKAWATQIKKYTFLEKLSHEVESVSGGDHTMYRLKAGAFKDRKDADDLCAKIKAAGGSCVVKQK